MKKFFNVPYDEEIENDLNMKIHEFNNILEALTLKFNLSEESKSFLVQMFLDGMSMDKIKSQAEMMKSENETMLESNMSDKDFYERISKKYHVDLDSAKMICHLLKLGIPMDTIMTEVNKMNPKMKLIEMPEQGTIGTGRKSDTEEREI